MKDMVMKGTEILIKRKNLFRYKLQALTEKSELFFLII